MTKPVVLLLLCLAASVLAQPVLQVEAADELHHWAINGLILDPAHQDYPCGADKQPKCWDPPLRIPATDDQGTLGYAIPNYQIPDWFGDTALAPKLLTLHVSNPNTAPTSHIAALRARVWTQGCTTVGGTTTCLGESAQSGEDNGWSCYDPQAGDEPSPPAKSVGSMTYQWWEVPYPDGLKNPKWSWAIAESATTCNTTSAAWGDTTPPWCTTGGSGADTNPAKYIYVSDQKNLYCRKVDNNQGPSPPFNVEKEHTFGDDFSRVKLTFKEPRYYFGRHPITNYNLQYKMGLGTVSCDGNMLTCRDGAVNPPICNNYVRNHPDTLVLPDPDKLYEYDVELQEGYAYYFYFVASTATSSSRSVVANYIFVPPWYPPYCGKPVIAENQITGVVGGETGDCIDRQLNNSHCHIPCSNDLGYTGQIEATCHVFYLDGNTTYATPDYDHAYYSYIGQCQELPCSRPVPAIDYPPTYTWDVLPAGSPCDADSIPSTTLCPMNCISNHYPSTPTGPQILCTRGVWSHEGTCLSECNAPAFHELNTNLANCPSEHVHEGVSCTGSCDPDYENSVHGTEVTVTCNVDHSSGEDHHFDFSSACTPIPCREDPTNIPDHSTFNCIADCSNGECAHDSTCTAADCVVDFEETTPLSAKCSFGTWTQIEGHCTALCHGPPEMPHAHFHDCDLKREGESCPADCDTLWVPIDVEPSELCQHDHTWAPTGGCKPAPCDADAFQRTIHGHLTLGCTGIQENGTVCTGTCDNTHQGNPVYECVYGTWEYVSGTCDHLCTEPPANPAHGHYHCVVPAQVGYQCDGDCDEHYIYNPRPIATCINNDDQVHTWDTAGVCELVKCTEQPENPIDGTFPDCTNALNGSTCYATCTPGHHAVPSNPSRLCLYGVWQPQQGTCEPQCTEDPVATSPVENYSPCTLPKNENEQCLGDCVDGFEYTTHAPTATCLHDHSWSYDDTCVPAHCDGTPTHVNNTWPSPPVFTWDNCDGTPDGGVCGGYCGRLYTGTAHAHCDHGRWVDDEDDCFPQCSEHEHVEFALHPACDGTTMNYGETCEWVCDRANGYCSNDENEEPYETCNADHSFTVTHACEPCACDPNELVNAPWNAPINAGQFDGFASWIMGPGGVWPSTAHGSSWVANCQEDHAPYPPAITATCSYGSWQFSGSCKPQCDNPPTAAELAAAHAEIVPATICWPNADVSASCSGTCAAGYVGSMQFVCGLVDDHVFALVGQCDEAPCDPDERPDVPGCVPDNCVPNSGVTCLYTPESSNFEGQSQTQCVRGAWSTPNPLTCIPICIDEVSVAHSNLQGSVCGKGYNNQECTHYQDSAFMCDRNYLPLNNEPIYATCVADFSSQGWEEHGQCVWSPCYYEELLETDYKIAQATWPATCDEVEWDGTCTGVCADGWKVDVLKGPPTAVCGHDGHWIKPPTGGCELIDVCKPNTYLPEAGKLLEEVVPIVKRASACSVNASGPLVTPHLCRKPELKGADPLTVNMEHIEFTVQWPRWLDITNITGTNRWDFAPYQGEDQVHENSYMFRLSYDDNWYYANVKLALKVLWKLGCDIVGDPHIQCQFWAHATEKCFVGPVEFTQSIAVRFPVDILVPGNLADISVKFWVYPKPQYDARISYFVMHSATNVNAKMIFLIMVPSPYMARDIQLITLPSRITATATPQADCDYYGTDRCFQQLEVEYVPKVGDPDPCTEGGLRSYSGTYEIAGGTRCDPNYWNAANCVDPPAQYGHWDFGFTVETNDFCDYYLTYDPTKHLQAHLESYDAVDYLNEENVFCGPDEWIYFKLYTTWVDQAVFNIKDITLVGFTVTVELPTPETYDIMGEFNPPNLNGLMSYVPFNTNPAEKYFKLQMSTLAVRDWLTPLLTPGAPVGYTFEATIDVTYEFAGKQVKLQSKSMLLQPFTNTIFSTPLPASTASGAATASSAGVVVGAVLGVVAIAAAIGAVWYFRSHRRGYTAESL